MIPLPLLTHSSMRTFKTCRKKYDFSYERRLRATTDSHALRFGTAFHAAIEHLEADGLDSALEYIRSTQWYDLYTIHTLTALMRGYAEYHAECNLIAEVLETETVFRNDIINPETGRSSQTFDVGGKKDALVRLRDGRIANRETKTSGEDITAPNYWRQLYMDPQVGIYWITDPRVETTIYDVIRKPGMRPFKATPLENCKFKKDGTLYANCNESDETPEAWEARLHKDIQERPGWYYARREIARTDQDLNDLRYELWDIAKDVRQAQITGRWYRNAGAMTCKYCSFFDLCCGLTPWDGESVPDGFQRIKTAHPELEVQDGSPDSPNTNGSPTAAIQA